ncbi:PucR family transcriptional regulator [Nocardia sp. CA-119907]|uniref:PucR family transcriptional regulator n=1 Tax=Nocardia sp. CA-119907 TaxID=3239973 RepID=UPI003D968770
MIKASRRAAAGYRRLEPAELMPFTQRLIDTVLAALVEQRGPSVHDTQMFREFGTVRAGQGITLEELLGGWRVGCRELIDEIQEIGRNYNFTDGLQLDLTRELLHVMDAAIIEFSAAHREVELERARLDHRVRGDFVRAALTGSLGRTEISALAQRYGLDSEMTVVPFRARPADSYSSETLERHLTRFSSSRFTTTVDGDLAGFVERLPKDAPVAVGTAAAARVDELTPGFGEATRALNTADAFGCKGIFDLASLGLLPSVLADTEVGDKMVHRYLDGVAGSDSAEILFETLRAYLDCGQHVETTAKRLVVHPNTIRYRITRYEKLAGIDLRRAGVALELWWALQRVRLHSGGRHPQSPTSESPNGQ